MESKYIKLNIKSEQIPKNTVLKKSHIRGFFKLASVMLPEKSEFPEFKSLDPEQYINGMIDYMYSDDRSGILGVLTFFSVLPKFMISLIVRLIISGSNIKGGFGALFRMLQIALKGLIFTIYYSDYTGDKSIHNKIGYDAKIVIK